MSSPESTTIDVGSWLSTLVRNWWVIVGFVALGAAVGAVIMLAQPKVYSATASVYIGQTTDANGNPMAGLSSNAKAAVQLLASQAILNEAAERTGDGMTPSRLRRDTSVQTPSSTVKTTTSVVNIVIITVTDTDAELATAAANNLADVLLERIESGVEAKITLLETQLEIGKKAYAASLSRSAAAQEALAAIADGSGSTGEKAVAAAPYIAVVQAAATEQQQLSSGNQKTELMLLTAQQTEEPRLLHEAAVPDSPSGPSITLNVAAGALAGLVIGIIVAFARRALAERRGRSAASA